MFTGATKIVKPEGQEADEFEQTVAQELFNLEVSVSRFRNGGCSVGDVSVVSLWKGGISLISLCITNRWVGLRVSCA